ncbi:hypothetical protein [Sulfobacillus harzensis]|uniref:Uncharacterized protein n=1 Tax=Sulfobacillus harzensis TaxID=2729629 RepID=A0A7Y0L047_9FIRM|nr:hypothetical protein [Sulfobacillus harzensis]NMP20879.1 hypothetical protein [Sulfobacillus harzensis]
MLLVTVGAAFVVAALFVRVLRPLLVVVLALTALLWILPQIPVKNATFQSVVLIAGLVRHVLHHSVQNGLIQYRRWGTAMLSHHHL